MFSFVDIGLSLSSLSQTDNLLYGEFDIQV